MQSKLVNGILTHINTTEEAYQRQIGFPKQFTVYSNEQVLELLDKHIDTHNCYVSVYSQPQITNSNYDKIYADIDSSNLHHAVEDMRKLTKYSKEFLNYIPRVYFSANKGFAVYFDFPDTKLKRVTKDDKIVDAYEKIPIFLENISNILKLKCLDIKVSRDKMRISRIPYTINFNTLQNDKTPKLCVPINRKWSLHKIIQESKHCKFREEIVIDKNKEIPKILKHIEVPEYSSKKIVINNSTFLDVLINKANKITDGRHRILMYAVIPLMVYKGFSNDSIHSYCKDFIETSGRTYGAYQRFVTYHISRNRLHNYPPMDIAQILMEHGIYWW